MPETTAPDLSAALRQPEPQFLDRVANPQNYPYIQRDSGERSTHMMAAEIDDQGVSHAFPMIVMMPDGKLKEFNNPWEAMAYNKSIGNTKQFGDIQKAVGYAEGAYKTPEFLNYFRQLESDDAKK
jgi:hypothetical protein